ncbi:MAG: hypothetical protein ACT4NV_15740 [Rhodoferax sp.]
MAERNSPCDQSQHQCNLAESMSEEAAERAVRKFFAILGVDVNKPESVEEFREDLRFGRRLRKVADHGMLAFFGVAAAALAAAVWSGIVSKIGGGH